MIIFTTLLNEHHVVFLYDMYMGHWEQDGKNVNYMARIFFRNRVGTTIVWHQLGRGKVFLAYQGFGTEERGKKYQIL